MSDAAIVAFCRARETLKEATKRVSSDKAESAEARRELGERLKSSMQKNNLECIEVSGKYVSFGTSVRPRPLRQIEDVLELITDMELSHIPLADLPERVAAMAVERYRATAPTDTPPKLTIVSKPKENTVRAAAAPAEVRDLVERFTGAASQAKRTSESLRPLRVAQREAEKEAITLLKDPVAIRMQRGRENVNFHLLPALRRRATPSLGVRALKTIVTEAAKRACEGDRRSFEARLHKELSALVSERLAAPEAKPYIRVLKM
jgi:hypothetical protein